MAKILGRTEVNITQIIARTSIWNEDFDQLLALLNKMSTSQRRRFEELVSRGWQRGDEMPFWKKMGIFVKKLGERLMTRGHL